MGLFLCPLPARSNPETKTETQIPGITSRFRRASSSRPDNPCPATRSTTRWPEGALWPGHRETRPGPRPLSSASAFVRAHVRNPCCGPKILHHAATVSRHTRDAPTPPLPETGSAVVELNRAIAVAEVDGAEAGLALVDRLDLDGYQYFHSTRADLLGRLGRAKETRTEYERALELAHTGPERRFLKRRLAEVGA
jgi:hypothetical protein